MRAGHARAVALRGTPGRVASTVRYPAAVYLRGRDPDLIDARTGAAAWLVEPVGVVTTLGAQTRVDLDVARFLTGPVHELSVRSARRSAGLVAVHDWSALTDYDPDARTLLVDWCLAHRGAFERSGVVRPRVGPFLDMAITVAATTLRVARMPFEIFDSLGDAMRRFGLRARATP